MSDDRIEREELCVLTGPEVENRLEEHFELQKAMDDRKAAHAAAGQSITAAEKLDKARQKVLREEIETRMTKRMVPIVIVRDYQAFTVIGKREDSSLFWPDDVMEKGGVAFERPMEDHERQRPLQPLDAEPGRLVCASCTIGFVLPAETRETPGCGECGTLPLCDVCFDLACEKHKIPAMDALNGGPTKPEANA